MSLASVLAARFEDAATPDPTLQDVPELARQAARGSCRAFGETQVDPAVLRDLAAIALAAPSKSDMQQRDIVLLQDPDALASVKSLLTAQDWIAKAPSLVIFCANNRRQRLLHRWWDRLFVNDHLDAFFNASVDAGIALMAYINAAEAAGLGCCPISTIRDASQEVSNILGLPDHVFVVAALAVGHPVYPSPRISPRLPLSATVHTDRYTEDGLRDAVARYDILRPAPKSQRAPETFGSATTYTWSDDKTRQYASPERKGFGAFILGKGFRLE